MRFPDCMGEAILRVGRVTIKNTTMTFAAFYAAVRKRFSSGRITGEDNEEKVRESNASEPTPVEPAAAKRAAAPDKKRRRVGKECRNLDATTSEESGNDDNVRQEDSNSSE